MPLPIFNNPTSPLIAMIYQQEEKIELDLNNPIFVAYVNTGNLTKQTAEEHLHRTKKMFDVYKNITIWVIASDETKIECVYDGQYRNRDMNYIC
jgi:hypothetical protein